MKKVTMIFNILFRVDGSCTRVYRDMGVTTAAGMEAFAKAPRSVITIDWSFIFRRFYEKFRS